MEYLVVSLLAGIAFALIYKAKIFLYWKRQNVPYVPPQILSDLPKFLSLIKIYELFTNKEGEKPLHEVEEERYRRYGRVYGRFEGVNPVLNVGDPDMVKKIFVKDFHIFHNRRDMRFNDPIMDNTLFVLEGEPWKRVRSIVTPTMTTAKLKRMLGLLDECCDMMVEKFHANAKTGETINAQQNFAMFVLNAIGRCAFGISINDLKNPNSTFLEKAGKLFQCAGSWRTIATVNFPFLMKIFRLRLLNPETTEFYKKIIVKVVEERKKIHLVQDDFLQMLLDVENGSSDSNNNAKEERSSPSEPQVNPNYKSLSHDEMLSQCITFFIAGFDATTSLLSNAIYRFAMMPKYQDIVLSEINTSLNKHEGNLSFEALSEMKFLDAFLNECLRMCPSMVRSERRLEDNYTFEEANITLKKDMIVSVPVYAIHFDPEWYPEPHIFKPERFYEPDPNRPQYVYLPFGAGPRICVGMRFVLMQVKLCLSKILLQFTIHPTSTTPETLGYIESRGILKVSSVDFRLEKRVSTQSSENHTEEV